MEGKKKFNPDPSLKLMKQVREVANGKRVSREFRNRLPVVALDECN